MAADLAHDADERPDRSRPAATRTSSNFGVFASPERNLVFDLNDFDETLPGPFEWDVKRLAASIVVAGAPTWLRPQGMHPAARAGVGAYRTRMAVFAEMGQLEIWYSRIDVDNGPRRIDAKSGPPGAQELRRRRRRTNSPR